MTILEKKCTENNKVLEVAKTLGLQVNQGKTKYMSISRNDNDDSSLQVGSYLFKKVTSYKYLGVNINGKNNTHEEIKERVASGNKYYYSFLKLFNSKLLSRDSKITLYTNYPRPVLTYGSETWATTKGDYSKLSITERTILRKIFDPVYNMEKGPMKEDTIRIYKIRKAKYFILLQKKDN